MKQPIIIQGRHNLGPDDLDKLAEFYGFSKWRLTASWISAKQASSDHAIFLLGRLEGIVVDLEVIPIESAVHDYNKAIPLTKWSNIPPTIPGEYAASFKSRMPRLRRWWNGIRWSNCWPADAHQSNANSQARRESPNQSCDINWRDLSKPPIILAKQ